MDKMVRLSDVNSVLDYQISKLERSGRRINGALLNLNIVRRDINQLPVTETNNVLRGKWDWITPLAKCSECGKIGTFPDDYPNYCPFCGADMREEADGKV